MAQEANNIRIESMRSEITRLQSLLNKQKLELVHSVDDYNAIKAQNNEYLKRIEFLEFREKELADTIDELFKEKNNLQNTLDKLLTGAKRSITYTPGVKLAEDRIILEPKNLSPYLPFCFPERLSSLVQFKREIRQTMRGNLKASVNAQPPRAFSINKKSHQRLEILTGFAMDTKPMVKKGFELNINQLEPPKTLPITEFSGLDRAQKPLQCAIVEGANPAGLGVPMLPLRQFNFNSMPFQMPNLKKFDIIAYSHKAFMEYMDSTMIKDSSWHKQRIREESVMQALGWKLFVPAPKNIFIEQMLAFRHRLSIKSNMKMVRQSEMKYSFLKEHRLKSVLETFGKTLDKMVQRYGA